MILGKMKKPDHPTKQTLYEYASTKGLSTIQVDEALYRISRGLTIPESTLKIILDYITVYIYEFGSELDIG